MNKSRIPILIVGFIIFLSLIFITIAPDPDNGEGSWEILFATTVLFTVINPVQDLIEVVLWVLVFKEFKLYHDRRGR